MDQERHISFLGDLHQLVPAEKRDRQARNSPTFVVVSDDVAFYHSAAVTVIVAHPMMSAIFLPPYAPFPNPSRDFLFI